MFQQDAWTLIGARGSSIPNLCCTATLAGLRTLIQTRHVPDLPLIFFDTMPSAPSRQDPLGEIGHRLVRKVLGEVATA
jgi:hypothetical protein